jgi:type IV secretion system protein VirD4
MRASSHGFNDPNTWQQADLRRRQISQLLHIMAPAASLCIVLSVGPDEMFPAGMTAAVWTSWPWNALLPLAAGVLIWDVRAAVLRRRGGRGALRPTFPVVSVGQAFRFAEHALALRDVGRGNSAVVWESLAQAPLAALVYTASRLCEDMAMAWLEHTVCQLASPAHARTAWEQAATAVAAASPDLLHHRFVAAMGMDERQRDSVALVMREAITSPAAAQR